MLVTGCHDVKCSIELRLIADFKLVQEGTSTGHLSRYPQQEGNPCSTGRFQPPGWSADERGRESGCVSRSLARSDYLRVCARAGAPITAT